MSEIRPATVLPKLVTTVAGAVRATRWRATLVSGEAEVWRCKCTPHRSYKAAEACGRRALIERQGHSQQRAYAPQPTLAQLSRGE